MSADKTNIHPFNRKLDNYNKSMVVPFNIKYIVLITYGIYTIKTGL
jgi:hypothetical protein